MNTHSNARFAREVEWNVSGTATFRAGRRRVGSQPGGGLMFQSGCPAGSAFQNMILSK